MKNLIKTPNALIPFAMLLTLSGNTARAGESDAWQKDKPCGQKLPAFQSAAALPGCLKDAYCAQAPGEIRVCACMKSDESGETLLTLEQKGVTKKQWSIEIMLMSFGAESLRLDEADLDGNGTNELLLGVMGSQSNGMGVQYWTVWSIAGEQVSEPLQIEDYGTMGFATQSQQGGACQLLVSRWIDGSEPGRGAGLYIVGRWYRFTAGSFFADSDRPVVYRRYLSSLERLRLEYLESQPQKPLLWYTGKETVPVVGPYPIQ